MSKVKKVCKDCGSEDVWVDATAIWNKETQQWELGTVFDYTYCDNCDGETTLVDKPVD